MGDIMDDWFGIEPTKAPKTPSAAAPDPAAAAAQQYQYNRQAAIDSAYLNAIDQYGPFGSTVWARRPDGTPYAQTVNLSPQVQGALNSQFAMSKGLSDAALKQIGNLPTDKFKLPTSPSSRQYAEQAFGSEILDPNNFADPMSMGLYEQTGVGPGQVRDIGYDQSAVGLNQAPTTQEIADTFYQQAKSRFQPDLDESRKQKGIELARRGIPVGSEIYQQEMDRLDRNQNNLYSDAARQAEIAAGQEQSRQFGQNLQTAQYGQGEDQLLYQGAMDEAQYYNTDDLSRRQFQAADDARLAGSHLSNQQFLGTQQNQQYNQLMNALGYGNNQYQTNLSNVLLERQQPFQEAAALMGANPQFGQPQFMNSAALNVGSPNYLGVVNQNSANAASMYNAAVAGQQKADAAQNQAFGNIAGNVLSAGLSLFSDENMKEDRRPADGDAILQSFREMPMEDYAYREGAREAYDLPERRTGTMAQDWAAEFGGDGKTIDLGDWMGKLTAAVMAIDKKASKRGGRG